MEYDPRVWGECEACPTRLFRLAGNGLLQHQRKCEALRLKGSMKCKREKRYGGLIRVSLFPS